MNEKLLFKTNKQKTTLILPCWNDIGELDVYNLSSPALSSLISSWSECHVKQLFYILQ